MMNTDRIYAEAIAKEYAPKEASKVVALKKLDKKAKQSANIFAYTFGIITALILGFGMCLSMSVIGYGTTQEFVVGIFVGIMGLLGMAVNYPIYKEMRRNSMQKYSKDIIMLAEEICETKEVTW